MKDGTGLYCIKEGEKILKKFGYEVTEVIVYDDKHLTTIPMHLRNTKEAAKEADKNFCLNLMEIKRLDLLVG